MKKVMLFTGLLLIATTLFAMAQSSPTIEPANNVDEAKALLLESWKSMNNKEYEQSFMLLKRVAAFDPGLEARFPEKKVNLDTMARLGYEYMEIEDWESALCAFELAEQYAEERYSEPTILPIYMERCQKKLAEAGKQGSGPMIVIEKRLQADGHEQISKVILVPAEELTKLFGIQVKQDKNRLVLTGMGTNSKSLVLEVNCKTAIAHDTAISLPLAPTLRGQEILVPVRVVAEYLSVKGVK